MSERLFDEEFLRRLERLALLSRRAMAGQISGERRSPKRGQSVEFADFRPYVAGDDFRRIDWNAYARLERFFIKLFVEEEDLTVHILIDASRSMRWGEPAKLSYALRAAGALGYIAMAGLDRVTVTTLGNGTGKSGTYFPPTRGKSNALRLFEFLQAIDQSAAADAKSSAEPETGLFPAPRLSAYSAAASHPGPLLLFSDLMDDGWEQGLNNLATRGFEVSVIHLLSPDEVQPDQYAQPPLAGDFKLLDSESGREVEITADYETLERYQQGLSAWRMEWGRFCAARAMNYVPIETSLPLDDLLFAWLRRQGVLR